MDSAKPTEVPVGTIAYAVTPAFQVDGDEVNLEKSAERINEMSRLGWELVTVDQGLAFWKKDVAEYLQYVQSLKKCGRCVHFGGNLCKKYRWSVVEDSEPANETCFSDVSEPDDNPAASGTKRPSDSGVSD